MSQKHHATGTQFLSTAATILLESCLLFPSRESYLEKLSCRSLTQENSQSQFPSSHTNHALYTYCSFRLWRILASWFLLPSFGPGGSSLACSAFFFPLNYISSRIVFYLARRDSQLQHSSSWNETIRIVVKEEMSVSENYVTLFLYLSKVALRTILGPLLVRKVIHWWKGRHLKLQDANLGIPASYGEISPSSATSVAASPVMVHPHHHHTTRRKRPALYFWLKYRFYLRSVLLPLGVYALSRLNTGVALPLFLEEAGGDERDLLVSNNRPEELQEACSETVSESRESDHTPTSQHTVRGMWNFSLQELEPANGGMRAFVKDAGNLMLQFLIVNALCYPLTLMELNLSQNPDLSLRALFRDTFSSFWKEGNSSP